MAIIKEFRDNSPEIDETAYVADNAAIIGDVTIGKKSSVWFGAVLRGDSDSIKIGRRSNIQDNAVVHVDPGFPVTIGDDCIVGHLLLLFPWWTGVGMQRKAAAQVLAQGCSVLKDPVIIENMLEIHAVFKESLADIRNLIVTEDIKSKAT